MTIKEYYNFPEGTNANLKFTPSFWETTKFDCVTDMSMTFRNWKGHIVPPLQTSGTTNMSKMFYQCSGLLVLDNLQHFDVSNVTDMEGMFYSSKLPLYAFEYLRHWDVSNVTKFDEMFYGGYNTEIFEIDNPFEWTLNTCTMDSMFESYPYLKKFDLSKLDTSKVTNMSGMLYGCDNLEYLGAINCSGINSANYYPLRYFSSNHPLTYVGGFIGMKYNWNDNYGLCKYPNLTYESCINILNGLHDFTGNGETPTSSQGKLKVHANFLTAVGDEISIGTNKGWTITV